MSIEFSPKSSRDLYFHLLHEDERGSVQMASVLDMNDTVLISDEILIKDHVYKLEQFRQYYDLQPIGESESNINVQWRIGQPISDRHFHYLSY